MKKVIAVTSVIIIGTLLAFSTGEKRPTSKNIVDFSNADAVAKFNIKGATPTVASNGLTLRIPANTDSEVVINGAWDFSEWIYLTTILENQGDEKVRFDPYMSGEIEGRKWSKPLWDIGWLHPKETRHFNSLLLPDYSTRKKHYKQMHEDFPNMRGMPDGISFKNSFDLTLANKITIKFPASAKTKTIVLKAINLNKPSKSELYLENPEAFFPFIDEYGQYKYDNWKDKFKSDEQFKAAIEIEKRDLAKYTGSAEWNQYGGYLQGPQLKKTGHFRTKKIDGKWWIIDPDGKLFWSAGVNSGGNLDVNTPYEGREHFFDWLPAKDDPVYGDFYRRGEFSFGKANLHKKYGGYKPWQYTKLSLQRMKSWGLNTFGGWSVETVKEHQPKDRVPYTAYVGTISPKLNSKFPDVFDPTWEESVRKKIKWKADKLNEDPFFFGYFVDNEMHWYEPNIMAQHILQNKPQNHGKKTYINRLKKQLSIAEFNAKTKSDFTDWNAVLKNTAKIKNIGALEQFNIVYYEDMCHIYFSTIKKAINELSPGNLYLGCRWHVDGQHRNKYNVPIGMQYLDIISFNQYDNELDTFAYPGKDTLDKPYMITEFNFGALDSGKFYPGLGVAADQRNRGEKYCNFIESALRDPNCVGAHWFMWGNSTTAGRSVVGENANCGLVSETDTPYYELIQYMRKTTYNLYQYRTLH